jgi:hypothetical protein
MVHFANGTSPPSEKQLRMEMELPQDCKFLGWAVHTPHEDGFLLEAYEPEGRGSAFGPSPEKAEKYEDPNMPARIVDNMAYPAVVTALFDLGAQILSIPVGGNDLSEFRRK